MWRNMYSFYNNIPIGWSSSSILSNQWKIDPKRVTKEKKPKFLTRQDLKYPHQTYSMWYLQWNIDITPFHLNLGPYLTLWREKNQHKVVVKLCNCCTATRLCVDFYHFSHHCGDNWVLTFILYWVCNLNICSVKTETYFFTYFWSIKFIWKTHLFFSLHCYHHNTYSNNINTQYNTYQQIRQFID